MKRVIIVAIGAFLMIAIGVSAKTSMYDIVYVQFDKTTMIKKKIADARMQIARGNYQAAINTINSIIRLDPENETAASLMQECEDGIARQKAKEYQDYLKASRSGSVPEMESFIAMYPQSVYVDNIRMCIAENTLWQEAKKQNTISAYEFYLSQSSMLTYKTDANDAIQILQSDIAWEKCKDSNDEYELSSFIQQYPLSPYIGNAKYKLNILRGERYFSGMDFKLAYNYLDEADRYQRLTGTSALHLSQMKERRKFESIISNTSIYDVRTYLKSLSSDSPYYSPTSNHLALLLGASLTQYSSELEIDEALFYAVDNVTNEIDVMAVRGVEPIFISCKTSAFTRILEGAHNYCPESLSSFPLILIIPPFFSIGFFVFNCFARARIIIIRCTGYLTSTFFPLIR